MKYYAWINDENQSDEPVAIYKCNEDDTTIIFKYTKDSPIGYSMYFESSEKLGSYIQKQCVLNYKEVDKPFAESIINLWKNQNKSSLQY